MPRNHTASLCIRNCLPNIYSCIRARNISIHCLRWMNCMTKVESILQGLKVCINSSVMLQNDDYLYHGQESLKISLNPLLYTVDAIFVRTALKSPTIDKHLLRRLILQSISPLRLWIFDNFFICMWVGILLFLNHGNRVKNFYILLVLSDGLDGGNHHSKWEWILSILRIYFLMDSWINILHHPFIEAIN